MSLTSIVFFCIRWGKISLKNNNNINGRSLVGIHTTNTSPRTATDKGQFKENT